MGHDLDESVNLEKIEDGQVAEESSPNSNTPWLFGLSKYQWFVLFAAWLGWGFDIFDGMLFNYISPLVLSDLLNFDDSKNTLTPEERQEQISFWTASLTSLLLLGWAVGGILFGKLTDLLGRSKTMMITILVYAFSTALCAAAPNIGFLAVCRFASSLGIGGEWATGATLVRETLPANKAVIGGVLLYTSAPFGLFLATFVTWLFTRAITPIAQNPHLSWRMVFLSGVIPIIITLLLRLKLKEPESWSKINDENKSRQPSSLKDRIADSFLSVKLLFAPNIRRSTIGGWLMVVMALIAWWSCTAFISVLGTYLANKEQGNGSQYGSIGTAMFNFGGLIGTLLTAPAAIYLGRRPMFIIYFTIGTFAIFCTFSPLLPFSGLARMYMLFTVGLTIFGVFGSFTFYLPELFPTAIRGFGSGFCYNSGRVITALGPFIVGLVVRQGINPLNVLQFVAIFPAAGAIMAICRVPVETKGLTWSEDSERNHSDFEPLVANEEL